MNRKGVWIVVLAVTVLAAGGGGLLLGMGVSNGNNYEAPIAGNQLSSSEGEGWNKVHDAFQVISESYVEDVNEEDLYEGAIRGMLHELDDPYSVYMDRETAAEFTQSLGNEFEGIGAEVNMVNGSVTIVSPIQGSPAEEAGLMPDDRILEVDGNSTEGLSLNEALMQIRGEKGTTVVLTIGRPSATDPFQVEIERDAIPVETVHANTYEHEDQTIGVIDITSFSVDTAQEFEEGLHYLENEGIDGLVIDVRQNPGGYLNSVQDIGSLLLPKGETIVQIEEPTGDISQTVSTLEDQKDYPIVGLINGGSASASEILAAALHEAGGYELVGETTFGKGTVQQSYDFGDGSEMNLSMFRWLTSAGKNIHEDGVDPTIEISQPDYFYSTALSIDESLVLNDNNDQVKSAQEILQGLGFEPGRTDGYFDEQTENAVTAFQQMHDDLDVTGEVDDSTAQALHTSIVEKIRDPENDRQLNRALEVILEQQ
ncbi:S41 family peptidase [Geomicrobium sediminis]|uniref:Carboxyl-terminal processing protease n=1 Tax=Geomicrobium sediminis TaxID=1347788 RepID=A0ABS2P8V2_9BACL|nr:S41 family peptidase [Geomicrobium sediminis]MBM7631258.1 carboxyl-terminal processing protease [Geomicrobium sediminis]